MAIATWYADSKYQREITHDAGYIYENYTNEPMCIRLNVAGLENAARADGADIVVTDVNGNLIAREIVTFDRTAPDGQLWVRAPAGDAIGGGTSMYLQWGGASVNVANDNTVWTNYVYAGHWQSDATDSSPAGNDGAAVGDPTCGAQVIGNGYEFDAVNDGFNLGDVDLSDTFTFMAWFKNPTDWNPVTGRTTAYPFFKNSSYEAQMLNDGAIRGRIINGANICFYDSAAGEFAFNTTFMVVWCYNQGAGAGNRWKVYKDGGSNIVSAGIDNNIAPGANANDTYIGRDDAGTFEYLGGMDEVRIIDGVCWSEELAHTHYDNENGFSTNGVFTIGSLQRKSSGKLSQITVGIGIGTGI